MKRSMLSSIILLMLTGLLLSACFTYSVDYGEGPQKYVETEKMKNHYFIYGLVGLDEQPGVEPRSGTQDYRLTIEHTFIDLLLQYITMGIYTPTTTTITE
ncbi:Bor/Iss family lipoprotein [Olavius algarvensis spirochete endosymbiont]|uniref:Bor/Iss family lipoprotein n=1 Tax=Olavius algarvensis spirochete endosymbiont TaxID=260710 RepID=UPI000F51A12F|nr:hypothetical protein [Olavius algarvensis spirochete endosymbiont]